VPLVSKFSSNEFNESAMSVSTNLPLKLIPPGSHFVSMQRSI
jgi:hypothetical protein